MPPYSVTMTRIFGRGRERRRCGPAGAAASRSRCSDPAARAAAAGDAGGDQELAAGDGVHRCVPRSVTRYSGVFSASGDELGRIGERRLEHRQRGRRPGGDAEQMGGDVQPRRRRRLRDGRDVAALRQGRGRLQAQVGGGGRQPGLPGRPPADVRRVERQLAQRAQDGGQLFRRGVGRRPGPARCGRRRSATRPGWSRSRRRSKSGASEQGREQSAQRTPGTVRGRPLPTRSMSTEPRRMRAAPTIGSPGSAVSRGGPGRRAETGLRRGRRLRRAPSCSRASCRCGIR